MAEGMESLQVELPEEQHLGRPHRDINLIIEGGGNEGRSLEGVVHGTHQPSVSEDLRVQKALGAA